jgi:hypothetical protein
LITAPLCYKLRLTVGASIDLSSAANAKQKSKGCPIIAESLSFVGADKAAEYQRLYTEEAIDEWAAEWNKAAVAEPIAEPGMPPAQPVVTSDEDIPF